MQIIMVSIRILTLAIFTFICVLLVLTVYPILPNKYWIYLVKMWAYGNVMIVGIKIEVSGEKNSYTEKNVMVIANHISWLDIPILYTQHSVSFVGRTEIKKWPFINILLKSSGTVFINRSCKRDLLNVNNIVSRRLAAGASIGLFPEGKTGSGLHLQPFKSSLLEAPILAKSTIIPLVIKYYTRDGKPTTATTYEGDITLWQSLISSLFLNGILVKVTVLPRVHAGEFMSRNILAEFLYKQINSHIES